MTAVRSGRAGAGYFQEFSGGSGVLPGVATPAAPLPRPAYAEHALLRPSRAGYRRRVLVGYTENQVSARRCCRQRTCTGVTCWPPVCRPASKRYRYYGTLIDNDTLFDSEVRRDKWQALLRVSSDQLQ